MKNMKKLSTLLLTAAMTISLVACGNQKEDVTKEVIDTPASNEMVYVPTYIALEDENANYYNMQIANNCLYYTSYGYDEETMTSTRDFKEYSLATGEIKTIPIQQENDDYIEKFCIDAEGNFITTSTVWAQEPDANGNNENQIYLSRYTSDGAMQLAQDITEIVQSDENHSYVQNLCVDKTGNIYVSSDTTIYLFDSEFFHQGSVKVNSSWIQGMGTGKDGKVYVTYYDMVSATGGYVLAEVDFAGKQIGQSYKNFISGNGNGSLMAGIQKDFVVNDGTSLYEYELATQSSERVLDWLDCDINGSYVESVCAMGEEIVAIIRDWNTGKTELARIAKKSASEVPTKQEVVIGCLYDNQAIQAAAVDFNKNNDTYRIKVKTYIDNNNWTDTSWQDAINSLNNDIISETNCPDILDLSGLNTEQLANKGVLEDLSIYLEQSNVLSKEDFFESIIEGYTFNERLVCIPSSFNIETIAGKTAQVGEEMGWTLTELMAYAEEHPDAMLFDSTTKTSMLYILMSHNQEDFINWESGECKFDTEEFAQILTFINSFPDEYDWESDQRSTPIKLQAGEVLLYHASIYDFNSIQEYDAMFNEPITFIGYPTTDASSGCYMTGNQMFAIASKSQNKEGAWAFIEDFLTKEPDDMFLWGLPSNKQHFEDLLAEATKVEYVLDEKGEPILDENGEPILAGGTSSIGMGDWEYTYHIPTEEEMVRLRELVAVASPATSADEVIIQMIDEEAQAYFEGQKSAEEVAGIIQSRVQLYVNENQ